MCFLGKHDKDHFESLGHDIPFCRPRQMEQADNPGISFEKRKAKELCNTNFSTTFCWIIAWELLPSSEGGN